MNFLKNVLAAILGCLVAFGLLLGMFFIFLALLGQAEDGVVVAENSILEMSLAEPIRDYAGKDETDPFAGLWDEETGLDEILHTIRVAAKDSKIKGISMTTGFLQSGMAQAKEIRDALSEFKSEGKFIYAHSDFLTQKDYYLSSIADKVYLNPVGALDFKGLSAEVLYFKELQEKTGIKMEVVRHGKFKSAVEPFLSDTMSPESRLQIQELISSIWGVMLDEISSSRNISTSDLNQIADTLGGRTPELAVDAGLIDGALHFDEYENMLREEVGISKEDDIKYVSFRDYRKNSSSKKLRKGSDKVGVIYAQGEIYYGEGGKDYIGQGIIVNALQKAVKNDKIKAIVLRVNSPGGSSLVSDIIWREVELAKKVKPVVVSFGNIAASGGYYIGVGGDKIFAEPTTVTGSIGVFATIPNINQLADKIGVNAEQLGTNKNSVDYSVFEPMSDSFQQVLQEGVDEAYQIFLQRVANGRHMTLAQVDSLAQGRVWSGVDAKANGLVDELGSLDDAIDAAAELAGLTSFGIRKYPKYKSEFERFMEDLGGAKAAIGNWAIKEQLGTEAYGILKEFKTISEQKGIQAKLPFSLNIK